MTTKRTARAVPLPPSFTLTGPAIIRAARQAVRDGGLRPVEARAIVRATEAVCLPFTTYEELVARFRRAFEGLAHSTTPHRAEALAMWTVFDPDLLLDECLRLRGVA